MVAVHPMSNSETTIAFEALRLEAEQHQEALRRAGRSVDRIGIVGPLIGGLLLLPFATNLPIREDRLAAIIVLLMSLGGLLIHFSWIEFLELVRYKYAVLYPRLYAIGGALTSSNYLEFTAPRSLRSWIPGLFYNAIAFLALATLWTGLLLRPALDSSSWEAWALCLVPAAGLLATIKTTHVVIVAARTMERDMKFNLGKTWYPPTPFTSPLRLLPFGDGQRFMVATPLRVAIDRAGKRDEVVVPTGFTTDLASVPEVLWPIFPPWERYGPAAVLHDYLYSCKEDEWSRLDADHALLDVMKAVGVRAGERTCIYLAVRWFGASARAEAILRAHPDTETQQRILNQFRTSDPALVS